MSRRPPVGFETPGSALIPILVVALCSTLTAVGAARAQQPPATEDETTATAANVQPLRPPRYHDQETPAPAWTPSPLPDLDVDEASTIAERTPRFQVFGLRPALAERGLSVYAVFNQFGQGVAGGGVREGAAWGGKFDLLTHLDGNELGTWPGATLDLFAEARLGNAIDGLAGTYSPPNLAMFFPVPDEQILAITGFTFTQKLTDRFGVFAGKLNALNGDRARFVSYPLTSRFWNAAFNFNLALDRYPYSAPGAGFYIYPERGPAVSFLVLDSHNSPRTTGLQRLGSNGVFLYAEAKQPTEFFGLPGKQMLAGLWGSGRFSDLDPSAYLPRPYAYDGAVTAPKTVGTWTLLWHAEQTVWGDPNHPGRGLMLSLQNGLGDGNPNPVRWFLAAQIGGNSPLPNRSNDTFGVGYYHLLLGSAIKSLVPGIRDEDGVEFFYNARITPAIHLTPDLQVILPSLGNHAPTLVLGLRLKIDY